MQKPGDAAPPRFVQNILGAGEIDGVEIRLVRFPHAGQPGQMIDLVNIGHHLPHQALVEHRALDIVHVGQGTGWEQHIENPHLEPPSDELGYQMLSNKTAAARNEYACHKSCYQPCLAIVSVKRSAALREWRGRPDDCGKIVPKAESDKEFGHHEDRS